MATVCLSYKYGYCKFRNNCEKIHLKDKCENPQCNGYKCDNRHPRECFFFKNFGRCKFGTYCYYTHSETKEIKLEEEVNMLKAEIVSLTNNVNKLQAKMETLISEIKDKISDRIQVESEEKDENMEQFEPEEDGNITMEAKQDKEVEINSDTVKDVVVEKENNYETRKDSLEDNKTESSDTLDEVMKSHSLDELIRENSGLYCEFCSWGPAKTKKGLITHKVKKHSSLRTKT